MPCTCKVVVKSPLAQVCALVTALDNMRHCSVFVWVFCPWDEPVFFEERCSGLECTGMMCSEKILQIFSDPPVAYARTVFLHQ